MSETFVPTENPKYYMEEVYKKWWTGGFISVRYWPNAEKVQIEIAAIDPKTKKTRSLSKSFIDTYPFLTYLHAEVHSNVEKLFPDFATKGLQFFGGARDKEGEVISRVSTFGPYKASKDAAPDMSKRSFRCAVYAGKEVGQGAFQPIYDKPISFDHIQMTHRDITHLYLSLNTSIQAYAIQRADRVDIFQTED